MQTPMFSAVRRRFELAPAAGHDDVVQHQAVVAHGADGCAAGESDEHADVVGWEEDLDPIRQVDDDLVVRDVGRVVVDEGHVHVAGEERVAADPDVVVAVPHGRSGHGAVGVLGLEVDDVDVGDATVAGRRHGGHGLGDRDVNARIVRLSVPVLEAQDGEAGAGELGVAGDHLQARHGGRDQGVEVRAEGVVDAVVPVLLRARAHRDRIALAREGGALRAVAVDVEPDVLPQPAALVQHDVAQAVVAILHVVAVRHVGTRRRLTTLAHAFLGAGVLRDQRRVVDLAAGAPGEQQRERGGRSDDSIGSEARHGQLVRRARADSASEAPPEGYQRSGRHDTSAVA